MHLPKLMILLSLAAGLVVTSCSPSNPARPSMSFAAPSLDSPAAGSAYNYSDQPLTVRFVNAPRTGLAAVTYTIEVATSPNFATLVHTVSGVEEGTSLTAVSLPVLPGNATYYWRTSAVVDGIAGEPSPVSSFFVRPAITLNAPGAVTPAEGTPVFQTRPTFTVDNATRSGQPGPVTYEFQVSESAAFSTQTASGTVGEQPTRTSWAPTVDLPVGTLYWRARALDQTNGIASPFTAAIAFERRGFGAPGDQLDLSSVTVVLGPSNIGTWPATGVVTNTVARPGEICIEHTKLGVWPGTIFFDDPTTETQGNQWMFAFINGRWYGGGGRWFRPGQACKATNADDGFTGTFYMDGAEPLRSYVPRIGDLIGLMSTTPARFYPSMRTVDERTNVVVVPWGG
jgi:hypothetical protein